MERWLKQLPEGFLPFWERFSAALPEGAWCGLVGGTARDLCSGQQPKDLDFEVSGLNLDKLPWRVTRCGKAFEVVKINAGFEHEVDVTLETGGSFAERALRRDFSVNAMAVELPSGKLIDPFGGYADLQAGRLRHIDDSLRADPLRVLRGIQFVARFGWEVSRPTFDEMKRVAASAEFARLPSERVSEEWRKLLLRSPQPSRGLELMRRLRCLPPELAALRKVPQDPEWHPEGNVFVHTLMVLDQAARLSRDLPGDERLTVLLAALCHDLGKPGTTRKRQGRVTAYGHEAAGVEPAARMLGRWCFSEAIQAGVLACVEHHMRPGALVKAFQRGELNERSLTNALRRLVRDVTPPGWRAFLTLCEADRRGRAFEDAMTAPYEPALILNPLLESQNVEQLAAKPLLYGRDLVQFGIVPGPQMGEWIRRVEQARDRGVVATREEALEWLAGQFTRR